MAKDSTEYREHWGREGFAGTGVNVTRTHHSPDFLSVTGPHVPHRLNVGAVALPDREDAEALPVPFHAGRTGVQLSASGRAHPMPFVVSNVEADEVHFVQEGGLEFRTAYGTLTGEPGDFVVIPRGIPYRVRPLAGSSLSVIVETPGAVRFDPSPTFGAGLRRAVIGEDEAQDVETVLLLKCFDGVTRYLKPTNPLATQALADGPSPVWKLNLRDVPTDPNGPPVQFIASPGRDELFYNLSARPRRRPPIHNNVDYDELIYYFEGPGTWGEVDEPGMLTCVPKGVIHHGPSEDVPEGYYAWMLESRCTLRLTDAGAAAAELMETDLYGPHATSRYGAANGR